MAELNVYQKLDKAEQAMKSGDYSSLKEASVISGEGQHTFMATLAQRLNDNKVSLPDLKIVDADKDGSPESITAKNLTIRKEGKQLAVESSSIADRVGERLAEGWKAAKELIRDSVGMGSDLGDALKRANTNDSELNRRWERQLKASESK